MAASFELMDLDSGNLVGSYKTLEEALAIVRFSYTDYGETGLRGLALLAIRVDGGQELIADNFGLRQLALGDGTANRDA